MPHTLDRRSLLRNTLAAGLAFGARAFAQDGYPSARASAACDAAPTSADIEGPYYLAGAPHRSTLIEPGMEGLPLELVGTLRDTQCRALTGAMLEFWQADERGRYDERGPRLRGSLETDARGSFALRTILPGRYLNGAQYRPAHIHLKVHGPRGVLTTQLYFEGDPYNRADPWFRSDRALRLDRDHGGYRARFDGVVPA